MNDWFPSLERPLPRVDKGGRNLAAGCMHRDHICFTSAFASPANNLSIMETRLVQADSSSSRLVIVIIEVYIVSSLSGCHYIW